MKSETWSWNQELDVTPSQRKIIFNLKMLMWRFLWWYSTYDDSAAHVTAEKLYFGSGIHQWPVSKNATWCEEKMEVKLKLTILMHQLVQLLSPPSHGNICLPQTFQVFEPCAPLSLAGLKMSNKGAKASAASKGQRMWAEPVECRKKLKSAILQTNSLMN